MKEKKTWVQKSGGREGVYECKDEGRKQTVERGRHKNEVCTVMRGRGGERGRRVSAWVMILLCGVLMDTLSHFISRLVS